MSHLITTEPELFPDPIDQAASEYENDIALSVKLLTIEKLRRIEQATHIPTYTFLWNLFPLQSSDPPCQAQSAARFALLRFPSYRHRTTICQKVIQ